MFLTEAFAQTAKTTPNTQGDFLSFLPMMVIFGGLMYFMFIRPQAQQEKKTQSMLSKLNVNDDVIFSGGIIGTVQALTEDGYAIIRVVMRSDNLTLTVQKTAITHIMPKGTRAALANPQKSASKGKKNPKKS
jgi:preprotein translocase subunit YajC